MAALKGLLKEQSEVCRDRNERENAEKGMTWMEDSKGRRDMFRGDIAPRMQRKGYTPTRKSFVVPAMDHIDWEK